MTTNPVVRLMVAIEPLRLSRPRRPTAPRSDHQNDLGPKRSPGQDIVSAIAYQRGQQTDHADDCDRKKQAGRTEVIIHLSVDDGIGIDLRSTPRIHAPRRRHGTSG